MGVAAAGTGGILAALVLVAAPADFVARTSIAFDGNLAVPASAVEAALDRSHAAALLRRVVDSQHLDTDPDFARPAPDGILASLLGRLMPRGTKVAPDAVQALASLTDRLSVAHKQGSVIFDIALRSTDAAKAGRLVAAVAQAYLEAGAAAAPKPDPAAAALAAAAPDAIDYDTPVGSIGLPSAAQSAAAAESAAAAAALSEAKLRVADVKARLDALQHALLPGHSVEFAVSDALQSPALEALRLRMADALRQEAAYKTTLGDRHPLLIQAEQMLRDLRHDIAEELKRMAATAVRDYAKAQAEAARAEKQAADADDRLAEARKAPAPQAPAPKPARRAQQEIDRTPAGRIIAATSVDADGGTPASPYTIVTLLGCLGFVAWRWRAARSRKVIATPLQTVAFRPTLEPPARPRDRVSAVATVAASPASPPSAKREDVAPGKTVNLSTGVIERASDIEVVARPEASAPRRAPEGDALPILGRIPLAQGVARPAPWETRVGGTSGRNAAAALAELVRHSFSPFGIAIVDLYKVLRLAAAESGVQQPWTLLVTTPGDPGAYAAVAAGLARAAVREGQRTLIFEGDVDRQYRRHLVAPQAQPAFIEFDRMPRPVYALDKEHRGLFLAPACPNPAALGEVEKARQVTIDAFDFVVVAGSSVDEDAGSVIAEAADMVLIVGQPETVRRELAGAATKFGSGKLCVAVLADAPPFIGARGVA